MLIDKFNSEVTIMALIRWQPFHEMDYLQRDMNRLFDRLASTSGTMSNGDMSRTAFIPPAELTEDSEAIHLSLEVPGLSADDLDIQVSAEAVSISGERKEETKTEEKGVTRTEFRYGRFQRVIPLSTRIQNANVQANYKDGILKLVLPKAEEEKNQVVKVNVG
jgi:HSP20 family protein